MPEQGKTACPAGNQFLILQFNLVTTMYKIFSLIIFTTLFLFPASGMIVFIRAGLPCHSYSDGWSLGQNVSVNLRASAVN
jgi:hypothetical protein